MAGTILASIRLMYFFVLVLLLDILIKSVKDLFKKPNEVEPATIQ